LKKELGSDYDVREFHFNKDVADGLTKDFSGKQTDISNALHQLNERFANQNIGAVCWLPTAFTTRATIRNMRQKF